MTEQVFTLAAPERNGGYKMPKYMVNGSYSVDGLQGVMKEGGSGRLEATKRVFEAAGGKVEAYYFTFGSDDFVAIVDLPNNVTMAGLSLAAPI